MWQCNQEESLQSSWPHPPPGPWSLQTAPIKSAIPNIPKGPLRTFWLWQESNSWPWAQLTDTEPLSQSGCDNFSPNVCIYTPEHVKISKESKFEISKNWPCQESNPGHQSHSQVIIPLDHCLILRNTKSENINLIWHHLVSHRRVGKDQTDISH